MDFSFFIWKLNRSEYCRVVWKSFFLKDVSKTQFVKIIVYKLFFLCQGRSEGTSSVAFEVLIINCQIYFINSFIFNCLTLNIKLFIFKLFDVKFLFSENHVFRKQKRTAVYGVHSFGFSVSDFKLTWENDDLLSLRHK